MNIVKYSTQIIIGIAYTGPSWVTLHLITKQINDKCHIEPFSYK